MNVVISQTRFLSVIVNNLIMLSALRVSFSNAMTNHLAWTYEPNYVPSIKLLYRSYIPIFGRMLVLSPVFGLILN